MSTNNKQHAEEQFPLLLFIVGNEHENLNKTNKTFKSRLNGITSGATTVITEWPNYISSCWTTSFIIAVTLFLMTLTFFSCLNIESGHVSRLPRCLPNNLNNETIHLVVHNSINKDEIELLKTILDDFPRYKVNLITILKEHEFEFLLRNRMRRDARNANKFNSVPPISPKNSSSGVVISNSNNNNNTSKQSRILLKKIEQIVKIKQMMLMVRNNNNNESSKQEETIEEIAEKNPNLQLTFETYNNLFASSPLYMNWMLLKDDVKMLAVRILQLFQYGGLSFDMVKKHMLVKEFVAGGKKKFENLEREKVLMDVRGLHMAAKMPCHAFFGKVLSKLHRSGPETTPESALKSAFKWFCRTKNIC